MKSKERTIRKELENFRRRSKPLKTDWRISQNKEQTVRKKLENFRRRSKALERD